MNYETLIGIKTKGTARMSAQCPECLRVFNLNDENDATEWSLGHDCEDIEQ